jgi:hypothetical protein
VGGFLAFGAKKPPLFFFSPLRLRPEPICEIFLYPSPLSPLPGGKGRTRSFSEFFGGKAAEKLTETLYRSYPAKRGRLRAGWGWGCLNLKIWPPVPLTVSFSNFFRLLYRFGQNTKGQGANAQGANAQGANGLQSFWLIEN